MKQKIFLLIFFIVIIIISLIFYKFNVKHSDNKVKNDILIKTNTYNISKADFLYYYNYLKLYNSGNDSELKKIALDHLIYTYKIIDTKISDPDIKLNNNEISKYKLLIDNKRIYSAKLNFFKLPDLTDRQIKKIYERNRFICIIDEIFISSERISELQKIYDEMKNGADAATINRGKSGVNAIRRSIEIGYLPWNIESSAYNMNANEITKIKTDSGQYLIKLVKKIKSVHYNDTFSAELVKNEYLSNFINETAEKWVKNKIANNKKVKFDVLTSLDFSVRPLPKKYKEINNKRDSLEKIVAVCNGNIYTIKKLVDKIQKLPEYVQLFFYNRQTRLQATKTLLYKEAGYNFSMPSKEYLKNAKTSILIEKILDIFLDSIKKISGNDSYQNHIVNELFDKIVGTRNINEVSNISSILIEEANKLQLQNYIQKELTKEIKSIHYKQLKEIEKSTEYPWLYEKAMSNIDSMVIDQKLLYNLSFSNGLGKKNIAYCKNWDLTIDDLFNELIILTKYTHEEIQNQKKLSELVILLAEKKGKTKQNLVINNQLLSYFLPLLNRMEVTQPTPDDDEIAIVVDTIHLTFGDLRNRGADVYANQDNKFLTQEQVAKIIEELYFLELREKDVSYLDLKSIVMWQILNDMNVDYNKYNFSDLTLKTIFNLLQEKFQRDKIISFSKR